MRFHRHCDVVSLAFLTVHSDECIPDSRILNSFRQYAEPQLSPQLSHHLGDSGAARLTQLTNKGTINLDAIQRQPLKIAQRRVSGPEVIDCNGYALRA